MRFGVYGRPKNKTVLALLRPKANNILLGLGWVMTNGIRAALRVLLSDGGANLSEDAESPRGGVCNTLGESHINKARERCWVYKG